MANGYLKDHYMVAADPLNNGSGVLVKMTKDEAEELRIWLRRLSTKDGVIGSFYIHPCPMKLTFKQYVAALEHYLSKV